MSPPLQDELTIYDLDIHSVITYVELFEYLDDEFRQQEESGYIAQPKRGPLPWDGWDRSAGGDLEWEPQRITGPDGYDEKRTELGVDVAVYSPGQFKIAVIPNSRKRVRYLRALNEYIVDTFADPDANNYAKLLALPEHPRESARDIDEFGDDPGIAGVFVIDVGPRYPLGHQRYEPLYEAAERNDLPIFLHSDTGLNSAFPTGDLNTGSYLEHHTLTHPMAKMWHATSMITEGIPERYDVKLCFLEAGLSWIQALRTRMDREYKERPIDAPEMTKLPSEYLSEFYYGVQPLEDQPGKPDDLGTIIEMNELEDQLVFATDYPHMDFDPPSMVLDHEGLTETQKRKITQDNPRSLLGL